MVYSYHRRDLRSTSLDHLDSLAMCVGASGNLPREGLYLALACSNLSLSEITLQQKHLLTIVKKHQQQQQLCCDDCVVGKSLP